MTDEQLAEMHGLLAEYHRGLAKEPVLDVIKQYHSDLAQRLSDEAALIPGRTAGGVRKISNRGRGRSGP
jgi:hypothetical protein